LGELFAFEYDLLLYDVTSTSFEGLAAANELAQRGYSRDHRPDCKQVCIALVVTREGMPLAYEVFAGNTVDVTTVEGIVESVESQYGKVGRIWVIDRGMVSEKNLAFLRKRQSHSVVGTPKSLLRQMEAELKQKDWIEVEPGITVRLCPGPEDSETLLVCRSQARREKEPALQTRFARRIRAGVKSLERRRAAARQPVSRDEVQRQIGRLLGRNARAASGFDLRVLAAAGSPAEIRIQCLRRSSWWRWSRLSAGAYVLRSNVPALTPQAFWKTYMQLTDAENAFRMQKSDLRLRPIWHQKSERVQAHILVCFLAYLLYKTQEQWANRAGLGKSPQELPQRLRIPQTVKM
jgi:transposase